MSLRAKILVGGIEPLGLHKVGAYVAKSVARQSAAVSTNNAVLPCRSQTTSSLSSDGANRSGRRFDSDV